MKSFELFDWVILKNGHLVQLTADTKYSDVLRLADADEILEPAIYYKLLKSLNKPDFWNPLMAKCPYGVGLFCAWVDEYKKRVDWENIFGGFSASTFLPNGGGEGIGSWQQGRVKEIKFHDIPIDMQLGILIAFFRDTDGQMSVILSDTAEMAKSFVQMFIEIELKHRNV